MFLPSDKFNNEDESFYQMVDTFAAQAMIGIIQGNVSEGLEYEPDEVAQDAYQVAIAMMLERMRLFGDPNSKEILARRGYMACYKLARENYLNKKYGEAKVHSEPATPALKED